MALLQFADQGSHALHHLASAFHRPMGAIRIEPVLLPDFIVSAVGAEFELAEIALAQAFIGFQRRVAAEHLVRQRGRFGGAPEIGTDDDRVGIEENIPLQAVPYLLSAAFAQAETRTAVGRIADDDALLICEAVAVTHDNITIDQAVQYKQMIQAILPQIR